MLKIFFNRELAEEDAEKMKSVATKTETFVSFILFIFGCAGSLLLHGFFSLYREQKLFFVAVPGLHKSGSFLLQSAGSRAGGLRYLQHVGSVIVADGL